MRHKLQGIVPPAITPFTPEGELDLEAFRSVIRRWNQTGLSGYLAAGSNGEAVFLNDKERDQVVAAAVEEASEDKFIMAGTGAESTRETIRRTRRAAELGADCALVITPCYFKSQMTPARLGDHYRKTAEAATIPILIYNFPQAAGVNLGPEIVAELSRHENIAGIKDSSGAIAQLSEIIRLSAEDFAVFVGNAEVFYPALTLGADGAILAVSNVAPDICVELKTLFDAGELARARNLQWKIARLAAMVTRIHGVGGLKAAMTLAGYRPGVVRSPLTMPPQEVMEQLADELEALEA